MRLKILVLMALFLTSSVSALNFGSYPVQTEKNTVDASTSFELGLVNPGETGANVTFSVPDSEVYNVTFDQNPVRVEPMQVSESPEGSGWYYLGDGLYTETSRVEFTVHLEDYRDEIVVPVNVRASTMNDDTGSRIVYDHEHVYRLYPDKALDTGDTQEEESKWPEWSIEPGREEVPEDNSTGEIGPEEENSSKDYKPAARNQDTGEGADPVTMVLAAGIIILSAYIIGVI